MNIGRVVQVAGPVVDVEFPGALPPIYNALTCDYTVENEPVSATLEVQPHLGGSLSADDLDVRAPRASSGDSRWPTAAPISMPVGDTVTTPKLKL